MPRLGALLLAAGRSHRMEGRNKLLLPFPDRPMAAVTAERLHAAGRFDPIIAVTGHDAAEVQAAMAACTSAGPVVFTAAPDYAEGLSRSLKAGIREALRWPLDGLLIALADMPLIQADDLRALADAFAPLRNRDIIVPTVGGQRGNPTLWGRGLLPEMLTLDGDRGAKRLMERFADRVAEVPRHNPGLLVDLDTPDAYRTALSGLCAAVP